MSEEATTETTTEPVITTSPAGSTTILDAQPPPPDWRETIPEKFRTKTEAGYDLNGEALLKSYSHLEKLKGQYGLPPESPDKYSAPEGFDDWDQDSWKPVKEGAHAFGVSEKQLHGFVIPQIVDSAKELAKAIAKEAEYADLRQELGILSAPDPVAAQAELMKIYEGDKNQFNKAMVLAKKAAEAYGIDTKDPIIGNNVSLFQALAKIGKEMGGDTSVNGTTLSSEDLSTLRAPGSPYWDTKHPEHDVYRQKVANHYEAQARRK